MEYENFCNEFKNILQGQFETEIHDWSVIKQVLSHIITHNPNGNGRNIVDFIDRGNWDHVSSIQFTDPNRYFEMTWDKGCIYHASVESIFILQANGSHYVLIKTYYQDEKMLNRLYSPRCRSYEINKFGEYMVEVSRVIRDGVQSIQLPNVNCYTTCVMTRPVKGSVTSNHFSELLMHDVNLNLAISKFATLLNDAKTIDEYDRDALQEKGNTARRYFEYVLMLVNIRAGEEFKQNYQELMLGSLKPIIASLGLPDGLKNDITLAQEILNLCSHHGGARIEKSRVMSSIATLHQLCHWIKDTDFYKVASERRIQKKKPGRDDS